MNKNIESKLKIFITSIVLLILLHLIIFSIIVSLLLSNQSNDNMYNNNIKKVVEIRCSNDNENWGYATGCFIDGDGSILTNKHVVKFGENNSFRYVQVRTISENDWRAASIIKASNISDLAMIKVDMTKTDYYKFDKNVSNGEKVYTIGNPNGYGLSFLEGVISSTIREINMYGKKYNMLQTSFVINGGNSGGPVFNKKGKLVGIMSFRLRDNTGEVIQGVSFAVPIKDIIDFI